MARLRVDKDKSLLRQMSKWRIGKDAKRKKELVEQRLIRQAAKLQPSIRKGRHLPVHKTGEKLGDILAAFFSGKETS